MSTDNNKSATTQRQTVKKYEDKKRNKKSTKIPANASVAQCVAKFLAESVINTIHDTAFGAEFGLAWLAAEKSEWESEATKHQVQKEILERDMAILRSVRAKSTIFDD
jgi:hypothetical protein